MKRRTKPSPSSTKSNSSKPEKTPFKTPSEFGSHSSMVVEDYDKNQLQPKKNEVVCQDGHGFYITLKSRLDTKLSDPNRYSNR